MALLLGRSVKSLEREVGDRVDERIMEELRKWWQRRNLFTVEVPTNLDPYNPQTPPPPPPPSIAVVRKFIVSQAKLFLL